MLAVCLSISLSGPTSWHILSRLILGTLNRVCFILSITMIKKWGVLVGYFFYCWVLKIFLCMEIWHWVSNKCPSVRTSVCSSVHLSYVCWYLRFWTITWVNVNGFSPNLMCTLILWRSGLGLFMGKFHQFFRVICLRHVSILISRLSITLVNVNGFSPILVCALIL